MMWCLGFALNNLENKGVLKYRYRWNQMGQKLKYENYEMLLSHYSLSFYMFEIVHNKKVLLYFF